MSSVPEIILISNYANYSMNKQLCIESQLINLGLLIPLLYWVPYICGTYTQRGAPQGGQGAAAPPPPNFGLQYKGVPKSPLFSLFCNSVYCSWLQPHNNVNFRPPNLAVLPPPLLNIGSTHLPKSTSTMYCCIRVHTTQRKLNPKTTSTIASVTIVSGYIRHDIP